MRFLSRQLVRFWCFIDFKQDIYILTHKTFRGRKFYFYAQEF